MSENDEDMLNGKHFVFGNLEMLDVYRNPICQIPTSAYFLMQEAEYLVLFELLGYQIPFLLLEYCIPQTKW